MPDDTKNRENDRNERMASRKSTSDRLKAECNVVNLPTDRRSQPSCDSARAPKFFGKHCADVFDISSGVRSAGKPVGHGGMCICMVFQTLLLTSRPCVSCLDQS